LPQEKVPEFLYELAKLIENSNETFSTWLDTCKDEFKELVGKYNEV